MPLYYPSKPSSCRLSLLLACILGCVPGTGLAAQSPPDDQALAEMQADCRIEGEAGGLNGTDLDRFIEECVADLLSVQFSNTAE